MGAGSKPPRRTTIVNSTQSSEQQSIRRLHAEDNRDNRLIVALLSYNHQIVTDYVGNCLLETMMASFEFLIQEWYGAYELVLTLLFIALVGSMLSPYLYIAGQGLGWLLKTSVSRMLKFAIDKIIEILLLAAATAAGVAHYLEFGFWLH